MGPGCSVPPGQLLYLLVSGFCVSQQPWAKPFTAHLCLCFPLLAHSPPLEDVGCILWAAEALAEPSRLPPSGSASPHRTALISQLARSQKSEVQFCKSEELQCSISPSWIITAGGNVFGMCFQYILKLFPTNIKFAFNMWQDLELFLINIRNNYQVHRDISPQVLDSLQAAWDSHSPICLWCCFSLCSCISSFYYHLHYIAERCLWQWVIVKGCII